MRCLYCGIRLKIAEKGQVIEHCPECSMRIEYENRRAARSKAENRSEMMLGRRERARVASAAMKSA
jgi:DNA-directed RNA polymerase subunit RPC12/RpoP